MQKRWFWGLAILLIAFVGCTMVPIIPVQAAAGAPVVVPGVSLADIVLGMPVSEVVARFGAPSQVRLADPGGTLAYLFGQYGITVYARSNIVVALTSTNSLITTARGIGLGAPAAAVVAAFGPTRTGGIVEGFPGPMYEDLGIAFGLDRDMVAAVMVFRPTVAAPSAPSPTTAPPPAGAPSSGAFAPQNLVTTPGAPGGTASPATRPMPAAAGQTVITAAPPATPIAVSGVSLPVGLTTIPGTSSVGVAFPDVQSAAGAALPDVLPRRAFTAETRYLSLAGYLRYLVFTMTRTWIAPEAGERLVRVNATPSSP